MIATSAKIPEAERAWIQKADSIRAGTNAASRASNLNVNLVAEDDVFVSREDYNITVIAQYLVSQNQENGEGPSRN